MHRSRRRPGSGCSGCEGATMNLSQFFSEAPNDPIVFWALTAVAILSAWQPLSRIYSFLKGVLVALYERGIVNPINAYKSAVELKSNEILEMDSKQIILVLSYLYFSINAGFQMVFCFFLSWAIDRVGVMVPEMPSNITAIFAAIFMLLGVLSGLLFMTDGLFQLSVYQTVRRKLRRD